MPRSFIVGAFAVGLVAVMAPASMAVLSRADAVAAGPLVTVSQDPFNNQASYHQTAVEPDVLAHGNQLVSAFQLGRIFDGASTDNGWGTSFDGGRSWVHGVLPDTVNSHGPYDRISDPVVGYDAKHRTWLISGLAVNNLAVGVAVTVNRSPDGIHWSAPIQVFGVSPGGFVDKDWVTCDNTPTSPFYGTCYMEFDLPSQGLLLQMSTSTDGGLTWSAPKATADTAIGLGGQPLVQPDGTLIVPYWGFTATSVVIGSFISKDGGQTYSASVVVSPIQMAFDGGAIRTAPLPSAQENADGTVYVAWNDCRFRPGCPANDIVFSTSSDGTTWSSPQRVPIDAASSSVDTFTPGFGVDPTSSGSDTRIGLYYYFYPDTNCDIETCQLNVGYISSTDGGQSWSDPRLVAGPIDVNWLAPTTGGLMFGDYIGSAIVQRHAMTVIATATSPTDHLFNEPMVAPPGGLPVTGGEARAQAASAAGPAAAAALARPTRTSRPTAF